MNNPSCKTHKYFSSSLYRYDLFMQTSKIPMCYRIHFLDMIALIVPVVFAIAIIFGAIGNGLVLFVVTFKQQMRNTTNILILVSCSFNLLDTKLYSVC